MAKNEPQESLASHWGQLAVLGLVALLVAIVPAVFAGSVVCDQLSKRYRAEHGVTPDLQGCAVPGVATWALCAAVIFAFAVWWGSGRGYPPARLRLGRSMLVVASAWFAIPAVIFLIAGARAGITDREWVVGTGAAFFVAAVLAVVGAWRGESLVTSTAAASSIFVVSPMLLYPLHEMFGVLVATVVIAPGLGLALATALTSPRSV